jgi:PAS domain S-box-containing protein
MMKRLFPLKWRYVLFLGSITLSVFISQLIIHADLQKQNADAKLINLAGRQRMLSQRIAKLTLYIQDDLHNFGSARYNRIDTLKHIVSNWKITHEFLLKENSQNIKRASIDELLTDISPIVLEIADACSDLIANPVTDIANNTVKVVEGNELPFLMLMEKAVATYQREAEKKLAYLKRAEWVLAILTILIVILGFKYIFLPSTLKLIELNKQLSLSNNELATSEEEIRTNLDQISLLQGQLESNEKKYRSLVENSQDLITLFDMEGNYTFVSASVKKILGYGPEELIGKFGIDLVHPEDREMLLTDPLKRVFKGEKFLNPQFRLRRKDGVYIWIEAHSNPILDENGKVVALQATNRDITERIEIEEALRKSEEVYRLVSENSQDFIALHRPDGTYTFVSPSVTQLLGYQPKELLGVSGFTLIHPDDRERILSGPRKDALNGDTVLHTQFRMLRKDGNYIWVEAYTKPILDDQGVVVAVQTSARNIEQRKKIESELNHAKEQAEKSAIQLRELLDDNNDLIGLFSHDMRSPVNHIKGLSEVMRYSLQDEATLKECLSKIEHATKLQLTIYENILIMLKSEQLKNEADSFEKMSLYDLIIKVTKNLDWDMTNKSLELVIDIPQSIALNVQESLFCQAIHNIVSNAIKFSTNKKTIKISAKESANQIKIWIADEGIGFSPQKAERLFDRFTKEGRKGTNDEISTGLGLYLVRKIISGHNGIISAKSEGENKGSVFTITIKTN